MTACLTTTLTRMGGALASSARRIGGGISCAATRIGDAEVSATKQGGGISCAMYQVCRASVRTHYLEISPKIVWVLAGHTENHVYSNTRWVID